MVLVFGGTTEGKQVASILDDLELPYYYSTKTKVAFMGKGKPIYGALTATKIDAFCKANGIKSIINASHPFAEQLHNTVATITSPIPLVRFERVFTKRVAHPLVSYVNSFDDAMSVLHQKGCQSLLALSGVQTIAKLEAYWKTHTTWFRILDRDSSRDIAKAVAFPSEQLLYGYPQNEADEIRLFKQLAPSAIVTKESGLNGKLDQKIGAALVSNIPIIIHTKPALSDRYLCMNSADELTAFLRNYSE